MTIKTILATACLLVSSMTMVAQTSSFLGYRATIDGQKYIAKDITVGENTIKLKGTDDTYKSLDVTHGSKKALSMKKALYCVKGTLTTDLVKKAAAENAIWFGAINYEDKNHSIEGNLNGYTSFTFEHLDVSSLSSMNSFFAFAYTLQTVYLPGASLNVYNVIEAFDQCSNLKYIDFSGWDSSSVMYSTWLFDGCNSLTTIKAVGCSDATISFLQGKLNAAGLTDKVTIITTEE